MALPQTVLALSYQKCCRGQITKSTVGLLRMSLPSLSLLLANKYAKRGSGFLYKKNPGWS